MSALRAPVAPPVRSEKYTVAEYAHLLETSDEKWEFEDGRIVRWEAMAGASDAHSVICNNASRRLDEAFEAKGSPCFTLNSDAKLAIPSIGRYRFPDVTIQCDDPIYDEDVPGARTNPSVLIEVVSESSRFRDTVTKLVEYARIDTLREYVLIERDTPFVLLYSRTDGRQRWQASTHTQLDKPTYLPSLDVSITLGELYRNVVWGDGVTSVRAGGGIPPQPSESDYGPQDAT